MQNYDEFIRKAEDTNGLPRWLLKALIQTESNFNTKAYRYEEHIKDASYGLCQMLYTTAVGLGYKGKPEGLYDSEVNIDLGAKYLKKVISIWKDEESIEKIKFGLGSYNAGMGNILKAQKILRGKNIATNTWDNIVSVLHEVTNKSADITIKYVEGIISQQEIYQKDEESKKVITTKIEGIDSSIEVGTGEKFVVVKLVSKIKNTLNLRLYIEGEVIDAIVACKYEHVKK